MITVTLHDGRTMLLAPAAVASITEAGHSSAWHGIRSYVRTFDGQTHEVQETFAELQKRLQEDG